MVIIVVVIPSAIHICFSFAVKRNFLKYFKQLAFLKILTEFSFRLDQEISRKSYYIRIKILFGGQSKKTHKRRTMNEQHVETEEISVMPLGAGCEVGRSCIILTIKNKKIMLDCGLMIGKTGQSALPIFSGVNIDDLSMILITHAHLDHCGALPFYLSTRTNFDKKVYMTQPTKDIYRYLLRDSLKVRQEEIPLFTNADIENSLRKITRVDFGAQIQDDGIKITPYCAGHIVGAAMFLIEVDGLRVLYTGDYSCEEDRYIMKAEIPDVHVDVLIIQSTYGTKKHDPRVQRETKFTNAVHKIVKRNGKCLLPVFSAGRAEELLHILDEHWEEHKNELGHIQIYYTCALIENCKKVYERYINMLSKRVQQKFYKTKSNPFEFKYINYLDAKKRIDSIEKKDQGLVVMCTPGMLQSGQSKTLFDRWCHDPRNGLIITGYCVQGSLASNVIKKQVPDVEMQVEQISFSAHADCRETTEFVNKVDPSYVVLVHGSQKNATELQKHLERLFGATKKICCPQNLFEQKFLVQRKNKVQVAGALRERIERYQREQDKKMTAEPEAGKEQEPVVLEKFKGVLLNNGEQTVLVEEKEKEQFFPEQKNIQIKQKMVVQFGGSETLAMLLAQNVFRDVEQKIVNGQYVLVVINFSLTLTIQSQIKKSINMTILEPKKTACLEFVSSPKNDIMAEQFAFLLSNIPDNPEWDPFGGDLQKERIQEIELIVKAEYPESRIEGNMMIVMNKDEQPVAYINLSTYNVDCRDPGVKLRFEAVIDRILQNQQK